MMIPSHATNVTRAIAALAAGASVGAVVTNADLLVIGVLYAGEPGGIQSQHIPLVISMFFLAFIIWGAGLVVVGAPMWWLLHRKGLRSWWIAVLSGAIAAFMGGLALSMALTLPIEHSSFGDSGGDTMIDGELTAYGWQELFLGAVEVGVVGAIVAAVIWRIAYRRVEQHA
jgi:hypothetical protein